MNVCPTCGYKQVKNSVFELHLQTHQIVPVEPVLPVEPVSPVEEPVPVPPVAPVAEPVPVNSEEITIKFSKPVEIFINAIPYCGKEVKVKNMSVAAEIVRIAREAYGPGILA